MPIMQSTIVLGVVVFDIRLSGYPTHWDICHSTLSYEHFYSLSFAAAISGLETVDWPL